MARLISASLQLPMPVSRSGVMLEAVTSNAGSSKRSPPDSALKFRGPPQSLGSANKPGISQRSLVGERTSRSERKGYEVPESLRRVPEKLPDCLPPVRGASDAACMTAALPFTTVAQFARGIPATRKPKVVWRDLGPELLVKGAFCAALFRYT